MSGKKAIVVGAGLVGSLESIYLAKQGYEVHVYDARKDTRLEPRYSGLSINLALSTRGIEALRAVGASDEMISEGIPMKGRMIHSHDGKTASQAYSVDGQAILSIGRRALNEHVLNVAEHKYGVHLHFQHKCAIANPRDSRVTFATPSGDVTASADLIVGADGAHSVVRKGVMRHTRMNFSQFYIPHGYKELTIPPAPDGDYLMDPNHLHIWPRNTFMMIALPNPDKTFTVTLFMPYEKFDSIETESDVMNLFESEFPDSIPLIGREKLLRDYFTNPTGSLVTVKCSPFHCNNTVLIGDAAHAIVPFYGQGMNAGFEDCLVLDEILRRHGPANIGQALAEFSEKRRDDAHAIADLALYNYVEMRDLVTRPSFIWKKKLDNLLHKVMPRSFVPLYTMVTFSQIPYAQVISQNKKQNQAVYTTLAVATGAALLGFSALVWKHKLF